MVKRQKLSLQQQRRVARSQQKKLRIKTATHNFNDQQLGAMQNGIVISRFGEQADVADENHRTHRIYLRQNLGSCVSGDRIRFRLDDQNHGVIEAIEKRTSELSRPTPYSGVKSIVANVDHIYIVIAPLPEYSSLILDRYLVACELANIDCSIVLNKCDLLKPDQNDFFNQQLAIYEQIGYPSFRVSCKNMESLTALRNSLHNNECIFVGQSGVGKSSLINRLLPDVEAATGEVSENSKLGTHTTTASRLYFLPEGGHLIDSPGVREFALTHLDKSELIKGYKDLLPLSGSCKFRNCSHTHEVGCALAKAIKDKTLHPQRLENFQKISTQLESIEDKY